MVRILAGKTVLALIDWKTVLNKFAQNIFRGFDFEFEVREWGMNGVTAVELGISCISIAANWEDFNLFGKSFSIQQHPIKTASN